MRPIQTALLIAALLLAACAPAPAPSDWCYTYDFAVAAESSAGTPINIISGSWSDGDGLASTLDGELIANYTESFYMHPTQVSITVARAESVTGPIDVSVMANFFGATASGSGTIPGEDSQVTLTIDNNEPENVEGNTVNATVQASDQIVIKSITVRGDGLNPFPRNDCAPVEDTPTPSPEPVTNTPSPTTTPTITPSITPTPTGTTDCWIYEFDFTAGTDNWTILSSRGNYVSGAGFRNVNLYFGSSTGTLSLLEIRAPTVSTVNIREIAFYYQYTPGNNPQYLKIRNPTADLLSVSPTGAPNPLVWSGNISTTYVQFWGNPAQIAGDTNPGGEFIITGGYIIGQGTRPNNWAERDVWCSDLTPTPTGTNTPNATPTATRTPSPTRTPLPSQIPPTATRTPIPSPPPIQPTATRTPTLTRTATIPPPPTVTLPPSPTPGPTWTPFQFPTDMTITPGGTIIIPDWYGTPNSTVGPGPTYIGPGNWADGGGEGTPWATPNAGGEYYGYVEDALGTAVAGINAMPDDITSIIPGDFTGNLQTFAPYVSGMISGVNLQELVGVRIYPLLRTAFFALTAVIFVTSAQVILRLVLVAIRFAYWAVRAFLKLIPLW